MSSEVKKNPKQLQLNPNWAQLQQKLMSSAKPSRFSKNPQSETPNSILGKRKERPNSKSDDAKPNPLIPTNDDSSVTDVLAMDCEMVGVGQGNRSALGRVTLVNKWGNVIYDEFVRPVERVVDFRTQISGIRPRDLRKAKDFRAIQKKVAELIKERILVGHALHNDLKALLLTHPRKDLRDTSEFQPFLKEGRRKALRHLAAEVLGVEIQNGEHCPVDDLVLQCSFTRKTERNGRKVLRINKAQREAEETQAEKETEVRQQPLSNCILAVACCLIVILYIPEPR